jgi:DNA-binding MarR family transcriptional regulator
VTTAVKRAKPRPKSIPDRVETMVEQWRRELPGVDLLDYALVARLRIAGAFMADRIEQTARELGMAANDLLVLNALRRSGPPYRLGQSELQRMVMVTMGAVSKRVDRLVVLGHVVTEADIADGRVRRVRLTASGRRMTERFMPMMSPPPALARALRTLSGDQRRILNDLLRRLLHTLERERDR